MLPQEVTDPVLPHVSISNFIVFGKKAKHSDVCYKPAADIEPERLEVRKEMMREGHLTSHDPLLFHLTGTKIFGKERDDEREEPFQKAVLSDRAQQLAGIKAY